MACILPRSPGLGRGGVALDLGILVVLPPRDFNNTVRLVSSASLDYFRFFAFEWLQGWFSLNLKGQLMESFIVPAHIVPAMPERKHFILREAFP